MSNKTANYDIKHNSKSLWAANIKKLNNLYYNLDKLLDQNDFTNKYEHHTNNNIDDYVYDDCSDFSDSIDQIISSNTTLPLESTHLVDPTIPTYLINTAELDDVKKSSINTIIRKINIIADEFAEQLTIEWHLYIKGHLQMLSDCALFAPRKKSALNKKRANHIKHNIDVRFANMVAKKAYLDTNKVYKQEHANIHYNRICAKLSRAYLANHIKKQEEICQIKKEIKSKMNFNKLRQRLKIRNRIQSTNLNNNVIILHNIYFWGIANMCLWAFWSWYITHTNNQYSRYKL
jgi:hypothetical protein